MKNAIVKIIFIVAAICCSALYGHAEQRSGFQIGKTWKITSFKDVNNSDGSTTKKLYQQRCAKIIADTLVEDKWYAIINESYTDNSATFNNENGVGESWSAQYDDLYCEEDGKLYRAAIRYEGIVCLYTWTDREPQLFLDFSANKGDRLDILDLTDNVTVYDQYEVADVAVLPVCGIDRKVMTLRCGSEKFYWIEGIGVHLSNFKFKYGGYLVYADYTIMGSNPSSENNNSFSIECVLGDELLYSWHDFERQMNEYEQELMAIDLIEADRENDTTLYDLTGRRIKGQPLPGLYIRGGKKVVIRN